jgi:hypothetical protein
MRRIPAAATPLLALTLMAGQPAAAQTASVIYLSCAGTVTGKTGKSEPVANLGLVINLAEHTVIGFSHDVVAHIDTADDLSISFQGAGSSSYLSGEIDRVTGAASAMNTVWLGKEIRSQDSYDLVCKKVTNRLF